MIDRRILLAGAVSALPVLAHAQQQRQPGGNTVAGVDVTAKKARDPNAPKPLPYTMDELFRPALTLDVSLSPDGSATAAVVRAAPEGKPVTGLRIASTDAGGALLHQARFGPLDTRWVTWASSSRVLIGVAEPRSLTITHTFSHMADGVLELDYRRILSVGLDGSPSSILMSKLAEDVKRSLDFQLVSAPAGDADHALIAAYRTLQPLKLLDGGQISSISHLPGEFTLYRADLRTGQQEIVEKGVDGTLWWMAQDGHPILRSDLDKKGETETILARAPGAKLWAKVRSGPLGDPDFRVLRPANVPGKVWVIAKAPGEPRAALRQFDVAARALGPAQLPHDDGVPIGAVIDPAGGLVAAEYARAGKSDYVFTDPSLSAHVDGLRAFFDYDAAVRLVGCDPAQKRFLVLVSGPQDPGGWYAYDRQAKRIEPVTGRQPWLLPDRLSRGDLVQVRLGDTVVDGCMTGPLDGAPGPLIVRLQAKGEPRDLFDYDRDAQAMAANGWWCLRCLDPAPEALDALVAHAQAVSALQGRRVAVMGGVDTSENAYAHVRRKPDLYSAAVAMTPRDVDPLLVGFHYDGLDKVAGHGGLDLPMGGTAPALLVYPFGDRVGAFNRGERMESILDKEGIGGLGAVQRLRAEGDHSWAEQASQQARMQAVVDFLGGVFKA
ncbi:MAG: prolyl oligopeptidase [Caulobacter sp.]|nr:prolyl oligopeptidase [Caulobacter sp.]